MATAKVDNYSFHDEVKEVLLDILCGSDEYFEDVVKTLAPTDNQKLTIDQRFGGLSIFKHPLQLVGTDGNNKLVINDHAMSQISSVDVALNIVAVTGLYRTGKSYLMNILANEKKGFMVGSRVAAQTKGIWAWCRQHPRHPDEVLLLLDTEGMSDPEKGDADHDNRLFCLTILLSSTMIYNHSGIFNHDSLQKLSFVTKMTESIRVARHEDISDDDNDNTLRLLTPTFIMCLRDFYLELADDDHEYKDANEFFESRLEVTKEAGKESNDEIRECIRKYFPKRRCFAISQPAMNKQLAKLETMRDDQLDKDFLKEIEILKEFVYECEAKVLDSVTKKLADGDVFEAFSRTYVKALNEGKTMTFSQAYERASGYHNSKLVVKMVHEYRQEVDAITFPVEKKQDLQDKCMELQKMKLRELRKKMFPYKLESFEEKAKRKMGIVQQEKMDRNKEEVQQVLAVILANLHDEVVNKKMLNGEYDTKFGLTLYKQDIEDTELMFRQEAKNFDDDERQTAFLVYKKNTKDVKIKVECGAKLREEEERNEKIRIQMQDVLKEHLKKHLEDLEKEKKISMTLELEKMKSNYTESMGLKTMKGKGFWEKLSILFRS